MAHITEWSDLTPKEQLISSINSLKNISDQMS